MAKRDKRTKDLFAYADDNRASIVYMITNTLDGKRYIGITRLGLAARKKAHLHEAKHGRERHTSRLYRAIRRDGADAFDFKQIEECETYRQAAAREIALIAELKPEYNLSLGGEGTIGVRASAESRQKMREAHLRNPTRYWLGKKRPDIAASARARMKARPELVRPMLSAPFTPERAAKRLATMRARGISPKLLAANKKRRKPIVCITNGRVFHGGVPEASETLGIPRSKIFDVIRGRSRSTSGLVFRKFCCVQSTTNGKP